jgi:FkbH-like protein
MSTYKVASDRVLSINSDQYRALNILLVSNITLEPFLSVSLIDRFTKTGRYPFVEIIDFTDIATSDERDLTKADIILFWLNFNEMFPDTYLDLISEKKSRSETLAEVYEYMETLGSLLAKIKNKCVMWMGFEDYADTTNISGHVINEFNIVDELNQNLHYRMPNISKFINTKSLISTIGTDKCLSSTQKYRWNLPYTFEFFCTLANELCRQYELLNNIETKKCVVVDCDNVLWSGILSEDGQDNIRVGFNGTGRIYRDFQNHLLKLHGMGVILTVCSKNDLNDVLHVFRSHDEMPLKEGHISAFKVNWENKATNIYQIAKELNIGLDSLVFIDDSIVEIEAVRSNLPEVTTIFFNKETIFQDIAKVNFSLSTDKEEISNRMSTYKSNILREELKSNYLAKEDYLAKLETNISISIANNKEYARISELSLRTNRCTNGVRYTIPELNDISNNNQYILYSVKVSDKFGSLGLIGVMGVDVKREEIDIFSLSCRALGRHIENEMLDFIKRKHKIKSYKFISTNKNEELQVLLSSVADGKQ